MQSTRLPSLLFPYNGRIVSSNQDWRMLSWKAPVHEGRKSDWKKREVISKEREKRDQIGIGIMISEREILILGFLPLVFKAITCVCFVFC